MALPLISVDDKQYGDLLDLLKSFLPNTDWTDHNPSDPGIMLLELLSWLGETYLYRMNRISDAQRLQFLRLIAESPEMVTVGLRFSITLSSDRTGAFRIPAGFRTSTDFTDGRRHVFETLADLEIAPPEPPDNPADPPNLRTFSRVVTAGSLPVIQDEFLGISDGTPNQVFRFLERPVHVDFVNNAPTFQPNPTIETVAGALTTTWDIAQFFPDQAPAPADPLPDLVRIDTLENAVLFGDGIRSAIPAPGSEIWARSYRILAGPESLVGENTVVHLLDPLPALLASEALVFEGNGPAFGGQFHPGPGETPPGLKERISRGLEAHRRSFRLVTREDFQKAILEDFNGYQELAGRSERIIQALPMLDRRPPLHLERVAKGNVTILLVPEFLPDREGSEDPIAEEYALISSNPGLLNITSQLEAYLGLFLEERRLLCTRIHFVSASVLPVNVRVTVEVGSNRNVEEMRAGISHRIHQFLNIREGGLDGSGWDLGRTVYRSHLYKVLEELEGVDHVKELALSPADAHGDVPVAADRLPLLAPGHPVVTIYRGTRAV